MRHEGAVCAFCSKPSNVEFPRAHNVLLPPTHWFLPPVRPQNKCPNSPVHIAVTKVLSAFGSSPGVVLQPATGANLGKDSAGAPFTSSAPVLPAGDKKRSRSRSRSRSHSRSRCGAPATAGVEASSSLSRIRQPTALLCAELSGVDTLVHQPVTTVVEEEADGTVTDSDDDFANRPRKHKQLKHVHVAAATSVEPEAAPRSTHHGRDCPRAVDPDDDGVAAATAAAAADSTAIVRNAPPTAAVTEVGSASGLALTVAASAVVNIVSSSTLSSIATPAPALSPACAPAVSQCSTIPATLPATLPPATHVDDDDDDDFDVPPVPVITRAPAAVAPACTPAASAPAVATIGTTTTANAGRPPRAPTHVPLSVPVQRSVVTQEPLLESVFASPPSPSFEPVRHVDTASSAASGDHDGHRAGHRSRGKAAGAGAAGSGTGAPSVGAGASGSAAVGVSALAALTGGSVPAVAPRRQGLYVPATQRPALVLVGTCLSSEERQLLSVVAQALGATVSTEFDHTKVTHVVTGHVPGVPLKSKRTLKLLLGMSCGCWVVSAEWLRACQASGYASQFVLCVV